MPYVSDFEDMMKARYNELLSAVTAKDWDKVRSMYTDDAVAYGPTGLP